MEVRLLLPWNQWSRGHVFADMPGGQARMLIERNIAEEVTEARAIRGAPVDRMMRAEDAMTKRRGRVGRG